MRKFLYHGMEFLVSDELENYVNEYKNNRGYQRAAEELLREKYEAYKNMDTAVQKLMEDMYDILGRTVQVYVRRWVDQGFYDLSPEAFVRDYYQPNHSDVLAIESAYDNIMDKYNEIVLTQEQKEEYRRMRKATRGRWVGGGFGVGGAIKGAATAGAFNAVSGLGHGMVNAIGNLGSSIAAAGKKRKLYENETTLASLKNALSLDILGILDAQIAFSREHLIAEYKIRSSNDWEKANTILQNIEDRELDTAAFEEIVHRVFELDPYNKKLYELLLLRYGDEERSLDEIADFFMCGSAITEDKMSLLTDIYTKSEKETLNDYEQLLKKINEATQYYGVGKDNEILHKVESIYEKMELEARTYENVVYDSIEQAEQAKKEKAELDAIFEGIDMTSEAALVEGGEKIEAYAATVYPKEPYLKKIDETLQKVINETEKVILDKILQGIDPIQMDSLLKAQDDLKATEFRTLSKQPYLDQIYEYIRDYEHNIRVVEGKLYDTVKEAKEARNEIADYEKIIATIDQTDKQSILQAEKTLNGYKYVHIKPEKYIQQVKDILDRYTFGELENAQKDALDKRDFEGVIKQTQQCKLPENMRVELLERLNEKVKVLLAKEIKEANEYENNSADVKSIILGMLFFLIVGAFLTRYFAFAFKAAVILDVIGLFGLFDEKKKKAAKKKSYDLICRLRTLGYTL